jgi:corrinoid protein of di/trimethylamine methyltransferase
MSRDASLILADLSHAVVSMDSAAARRAAEEALAAGIAPLDAIEDGLSLGMNRVNELFEQEEYFVPEILLCADAMNAGIEVLEPHLPRESAKAPSRVVIGVVKGDTHDIGKNLVRIMTETAGFEVVDLGRDVPYARFVESAGDLKADLVCLSTLMTSTMDGMKVVVDGLRAKALPAKVLVGGGPISAGFAKRIGADGYGKTAVEAVKVARSVLRIPAGAAR